MSQTRSLIELLISGFPNMPPVEEVTHGRDLEEVYMEGGFCKYCPSVDTCTNPPALLYKGEKENPDERLKMLLAIMGLSEDKIAEVAGNQTVSQSYNEGKYCKFCPAFRGCHNEPAQQYRNMLN